jgi:hypothetical protein
MANFLQIIKPNSYISHTFHIFDSKSKTLAYSLPDFGESLMYPYYYIRVVMKGGELQYGNKK